MRFNDRIDLIAVSKERYDPNLGEYIDGIEDSLTVPAYVMDMSLQRQELVYGEFKKGTKTVFLQRKPSFIFTKVRYKGKLYKVTAEKQSETVFYLEGDDSIG